MPVAREAVKLLKGKPKQWSRPSASGRAVVCFFCGECGTRLVGSSLPMPVPIFSFTVH
ncbi:MAG: GFA family protein [Cyanobacteria bacterium P01_A01_bin.15]